MLQYKFHHLYIMFNIELTIQCIEYGRNTYKDICIQTFLTLK